ncbi:MAG: acylneuraminate cytidylyltransferase family protein [Sulfitobacter sp.]
MIRDPHTGADLRVLAIVPARGGSKGLPRKNIARIADVSLIARTARAVRACDWIDGAVISTDDLEFAAEARGEGLDMPALRPAELANDTAKGVDVWAHAWREAEQTHGVRYDLSVYLQPTSPFRTPTHIHDTVSALLNGQHQAATTISQVPGHYAPQKTLTLDENGVLHFYTADGAKHSNRQTTAPTWTRNGLCYAARRAHVVDQGLICESDCGAVKIEGYVANIDDPEDLLIAQLLAEHGGYDILDQLAPAFKGQIT